MYSPAVRKEERGRSRVGVVEAYLRGEGSVGGEVGAGVGDCGVVGGGVSREQEEPGGGELRETLVLPGVEDLIGAHDAEPPLMRCLVHDGGAEDVAVVSVRGKGGDGTVFHPGAADVGLHEGECGVRIDAESLGENFKGADGEAESVLRVGVGEGEIADRDSLIRDDCRRRVF